MFPHHRNFTGSLARELKNVLAYVWNGAYHEPESEINCSIFAEMITSEAFFVVYTEEDIQKLHQILESMDGRHTWHQIYSYLTPQSFTIFRHKH